MCNGSMVRSVMVEDMTRPPGFYCKLGLKSPEGAEEQEHMGVEMGIEIGTEVRR